MPQLRREDLSQHDQAVLDSIFNPVQVGGDVPNLFDPEITADLEDSLEEETPEVLEAIRLELEAVQLAESGDLDRALDIFASAIKVAPNKASLYNNRAQTYRFMGNNDDAAFTDLDKAINISKSKGRTGCQALCQRGVLYRKRENLEAARHDFEIAAKLGSKFATTQLIEINPYAALCNQMLRDAYQKLS